MKQKIYDMIKDAEMVLIGIGEEFSPKYPGIEEGMEGADQSGCDASGALLEMYRKSRFYAQLGQEHEVIKAYNKLRGLIGAKPYFVVTMNTDDLICKSDFEQDLIVAPCGSMQKMQCAEHIVEAEAVRERVLAAADAIAANGSVEAIEKLLAQEAVCPICGAPLSFHMIGTEGYLEEGYLPQWSRYTKWLSCTLNRKLCVLELGVDFKFPQVVRFPFEKVAAYNRKASLVRVNSKFPQLPEEMSQRGVSVKESPVQFLLNF